MPRLMVEKISVFFLLVFIFLFCSAFSPKEWKDSIYKQIKIETTKGLKANFNTEVKIGSTGGIVIGQVVFKDVVIPNFAKVPEIYVNYNPIVLALKRDAVPAITNITIVGGEFEVIRNSADQWNVLSFLLPADPNAPPPPPFQAKLIFQNCKINYKDQRGFRKAPKVFQQEFQKVGGTISFQRKDRIDLSLAGVLEDSPVKVFGSNNYKTGKFVINLAAQKVNLEKWGNYAVPLDPLVFESGEAGLKIKLTPAETELWPVTFWGDFSFSNLQTNFGKYSGSAFLQLKEEAANGSIHIEKGDFRNQEFSGRSSFTFKENILKIDNAAFSLYKGRLAGSASIDFSKHTPLLNINADLEKLDLAAISQNSPGLVGRATGKLSLQGALADLKGNLSARLTQAMLFGQTIDNLSSSFRIKEGNIQIEDFSAASKTASLHSSGKISHDLVFAFETRAEGIKLSGEGLLGKMEALIDLFQGAVSWKLNEAFLANPLKNLSARGEAILSRGNIGEQQFDFARGKLSIGKGLLFLEEATFKRGKSTLLASGQTGIGFPTLLKITGEKLNFEDLKILNHLLPAEAKNPSGFTDINIEITGDIPKEARITSFDPLLDLNAEGKISLHDVFLAEIPITSGKINFQWQKRSLDLSPCTLEMPDSNQLSFDLKLDQENSMKGKILGTFDLLHFKKLTEKYGALQGKAGINLILNGKIKNPRLALTFWLDKFSFNRTAFDRINGRLDFKEGELILSEPLQFFKDESHFKLSGSANLNQDQLEESSLDLELEVKKGDLATIFSLYQNLQNEISHRHAAPQPGGKSKINLSSLVIPGIRQFTHQGKVLFLSQDGEKDYFLKSWGKVWERAKKEGERREEKLGGELFGNIAIQGQLQNLSGKMNAQIKNGFYKDFSFEELKAKASLKNQKIVIDNLELSKKKGKLLSEGEIGFDGRVSLRLFAKNLPLDSLRLFFDQDFAGDFNLSASVEGNIQNPNLSALGEGKNLSFAGVYFDQASFSLTKKGDRISIQKLSLLKDKRESTLSGFFPLSSTGQIALELDLKDNAAGLLNLFTKEIRWLNGKSFALINIKGERENPDINGKIFLKESTLYAKLVDSEIKNIEGEAKIENNLLKIKGLSGFWQGRTSKNFANPLALAGTIDLTHFFSEKGKINLNLIFAPSVFAIDLPNLYSGKIRVKAARLMGPFAFDLSQGPTLSGEAEVNDALIILAKSGAGSNHLFPLHLDLTVDLNKNVYAVREVDTLDLSNISMNFEIYSQGLKITESLASPSLLGKVSLKRGTVTIFNREFSLLSTETQKKYYSYEKIKENLADFKGGKGAEGIMPEISVTAKVDVEQPEKDESGQITKKNVIILSRLEGIMGATEIERGLKTSFNSFREDKTKTPAEFIPANYSEQDVKVMLLPDFIKSLTGITKGEEAKVDTNAIVADYLSSRLQTWAFRAVEREVERALGLESLTLEYNFGKDVRQAMGIKEERTIEGEKPDLRVGFVKGFFDKFYIDVKYSQSLAETGLTETFNYQLTYKLSPIWSIIYYREPPSLRELIAGYQKVTLQARLSFW